jgi:eukaryotic-like serine/threonine-protein kinase
MRAVGADFVGRVLGARYRLLAPVGTGASATVFQADDVQLRRQVAVKVLHPSLAADPAFLKRFRAEAQAAAALSHPNILAIFDWGEDGSEPYLVMEFLAGGSLRSMLDVGRRLTPSQALVVGLEAARGLDYAHRRGFVHRDVKPANLLFGDDGRLRIADFGLARALAEAAWTEPAGVVLGTARYASPEQAKGQSVEGKTDVYSLALSLIESITGQVPFAADTTVATLQNRIDKLLPVSAELGPLAAVIERAGRPDPAERFDAAELGKALIAVAERLPRPDPLPLVPLSVAAPRDEFTMLNQPSSLQGAPLDPVPPVHESRAASGQTSTDGARAQRAQDRPDDRRGGVEAGTEPRPTSESRRGRASAPPESVAAGRGAGRGAGRRRRVLPWLVAAVLAVGAAAAGVWFTVIRDSTATYEVPQYSGLTADQVSNLALPNKWEVRTKHTRLDGTVEGSVVEQSPVAGTKLARGGTLEITVSDGPTLQLVPDLAGKAEADVRTTLESAGFLLGQVRNVGDEAIAAGTVLDWTPKNEEIPKGTTIDVTFSLGPLQRQVPADLPGKTYDEVAAVLTVASPGLQLKVERIDQFDEKAAIGIVMSTSPAAGALVDRDALVQLIVSKGPELVAVPDVKGKTLSQAVAAVTAAGLRDGTVTGRAGGKVTSSVPAAGEQVRKNTAVNFVTS